MKPIYFKEEQRPKKVIIGYLWIIFIALSPILIALLAGSIGYCMGCHITEAGGPCVKLGIDFGPLLSGIGVLSWFSLITISAGCIVFLIWTFIGIYDAICHSYNKR